MADNADEEFALVYVPCPDLETAERLGGALVEARLAACVNILPQMVSIYPWEGRVEREEETVMIDKTALRLAGAARDFVEGEHPYEVPAILVLPLASVNASYARWLCENVSRGQA